MLFVLRQLRPVIVSRVRIATAGGIENVGPFVGVTHFLFIKDTRAAMKCFRAAGRRGEQFVHRPHGTVVQIGRARPNSVQRRGPIFSRAPHAKFFRRMVALRFEMDRLSSLREFPLVVLPRLNSPRSRHDHHARSPCPRRNCAKIAACLPDRTF